MSDYLTPCDCGRDWYDPTAYTTCYQCFVDRRSHYLRCIFCGRWHSPQFDTCYECRRIYNREEAGRHLRMDILVRDGRCRVCGSTQLPNIDHIKPCAEGGNADPWNLQVLCHDCNHRKGATWWPGCRWDRTRRDLVRAYRVAGWPLLDDDQRARLRREVDHYAHWTTHPAPVAPSLVCVACHLPMEQDFHGDGRHPACRSGEPTGDAHVGTALAALHDAGLVTDRDELNGAWQLLTGRYPTCEEVAHP